MSMRRYEVVFVLAPKLTEEEVKDQTETFTKVAQEKGAKVLNVDDWGKRRLAFPVKKNKEGTYVILTLEEAQADAVFELERRFRVSDNVIRHLTVRIDEDLKRAEKFETRRKQRKLQKTEAAQPEAEVTEAKAEPKEKEAAAPKSKAKKEPAESEEESPKTAAAEVTPAEEAESEEAPAEETASAEEASSDESSEEEETAEEEKKSEDAKAVEEK